jgi:hypothetical protein
MKNEGAFIGVDLNGSQPRLIEEPAGLGHNSEVGIIARINYTLDSLDKLREGHEKELHFVVDKQEDEGEALLATLGKQLLEGRKLHKSDSAFGKFCLRNFPNLRKKLDKDELTALVWAAEFPEQRQGMSEKYPRVKTTRGAYAKWKKEQKEPPSDTNGDTDSVPPKDDKPWNTENPDTTRAKGKLSTVASSIFGVLTNVQLFEETNGEVVDTVKLTRAILSEINIQGERTDEEIQGQVNGLRYILDLLSNSLPVIDGKETNVINLSTKMKKGTN